MNTIKINGIDTPAPAGAIAYKYADPTEAGTVYRWATDAASGTVVAQSLDAAIAKLVEQREWAMPDSAREQRDIADGAWLMVGEGAAGECAYRRGIVP